MQSSVSEPGRKKLKANWRIEFDEELDFLFGVGEGNRIRSTLFGDEEVSFELSLWNVYGGVALEAKFICKKQMMYVYVATFELPDETKIVGTPCRGTMSNGSTCRTTFTVPAPLIQPYFKVGVVLGYYPSETERFVSRKVLRKCNAAPHAASWLTSVFEKGTFSDCKIQVEGHQIDAHRVVLGAQSKVFEAMLLTKAADDDECLTYEEDDRLLAIGEKLYFEDAVEYREIQPHQVVLDAQSSVSEAVLKTKSTDVCRTGEIVIDDASYQAVKAMVEYLYDGSVEKVRHCAPEVYRLADKYQIDDLKYCCFEIFGKDVDEKNFCQIWSWVYQCSTEEIKTMCRDFVRRHNAFLASKEWKQFKEKKKDAAVKLYDYVPVMDLVK